MKITEDQEQQLLNLNDSRVNEILEFNPYNEWYKFEGTKFLMFIHNNGRYGFTTCGYWWDGETESKEYNKTTGYIKATKQEIEEALIVEAKRRGFVKGSVSNNSNIHNLKYQNYTMLKEPILEYDIENNSLREKVSDGQTRCIFHNGVWSEVIKHEENNELSSPDYEPELNYKNVVICGKPIDDNVYISDLNENNLIGLKTELSKSFIIKNSNGKFLHIMNKGYLMPSCVGAVGFKTIQDLIDKQKPTEVLIFNERQHLFEWLSKD